MVKERIMTAQQPNEVIFEMTRVGSTMRVMAYHVQTGLEAVIQGPANYSPDLLKKNALRKLSYILQKQGKN